MTIIIPQEETQTVNPPRFQPQANETTFGGGPGLAAEHEQIQKIAQSTNEIATFEKIRADQTAVQGATAQSADTMNKLMYELHSYQGVNAMDGQKKVLKDFEDQANGLAKGLQPDQQGAFNKFAIEHRTMLNNYAMGYVSNQLDQHETNTFKAATKTNAESAGLQYGNPEAINTLKNQNDKMVGAWIQRKGLTGDEATDFKRTMNSMFYEKVLGNMVNDGNFQDKAKQLYADHRAEIDSDTRDRIEKWMGDGSIKSQANKLVADAMKASPKSESEALARADKNDDPDVRSMARQIISAQFTQNRAAEKNDKEQSMMVIQNRIGKLGLTDPEDIKQNITTTEKNSITGVQYQALLKSGQDNVTSPRMMVDFYQSIKDKSLIGMSRADLQTKFLQYASLSDQKQILKTWADGQKGGKQEFSSAGSFGDMQMQAAVDAKIVPSKNQQDWRDDERHNWKILGDEVAKQKDLTEAARGKKLAPSDIRDLFNKVVIDHTFEKKGWFGSTSEEFEPYTKEFSAAILTKFPSASEDQIAQAYSMVQRGMKAPDVEAFLKGK